MIEDPELKLLFQAESEERLIHLEQGLKQLEKDPQNLALIEDLFRDAHTLKGSARMLGLRSIETIVHAIENVFDSLRKNQISLSAVIVSSLFVGIDALASYVEEAIHNTPPNIKEEDVLAILQGKKVLQPSPPKEEAPETKSQNEALHVAVPSSEKIEKITSVRISVDKVDELIREASELLISKNRLLSLRTHLDQINYLDELSAIRTIAFEETRKLDTLANTFIDHIQELNLVPISKLFNLFPRTIREISHALGKEADLIIMDGDLKVDKRIVEELKDPLVHILRNSISHGIELPSEREAHGKKSKGTITINTEEIDNQVVIEISDDGRGLELEKIKKVALEKKIYSEAELQNLSLEGIYALIFAPGFSTAQQVTDISGRGVGLDVVQRTVEHMNGKINVNSVPGLGTTFRIELPSSLLASSILLIRENNQTYGIPTKSIEGCELLSQCKTLRSEHEQIVIRNGRPESLILLDELLYDLPRDSIPETKEAIFMNIFNERFAIAVDQIIGDQTIVIQPLSPFLRETRTLIGTALLSSGDICLILNPSFLHASVRKTKNTSASNGKKRN
jgi:two-component system, chemotaxis family, sensor kinase CheA